MGIEREELRERLKWLIRLRWVGIIGVLVVTHVVREIAFMTFSLIPVYAILGFASFYNGYLTWKMRFPNADPARLALFQILLDQATLALAVYFSGGCDSPFIYFFIFHVVISGIILPWKKTMFVAGLAVVFPALVMGLKHQGILPHYGIFKTGPMIFTDLSVIGSYGLAFIVTIFLTAYFVTYLSKKLYEKNEEVARLYTLSERLRSTIRLREVIEIVEREVRGLTGSSKSIFLSLDKEKRRLVYTVGGEQVAIPLMDKNSFTDAVVKGTAKIIDRRVVTSDYETRMLERLESKRCMALPVMGASLLSCREYFHCADSECGAYGKETGRCWQISGTHCKGTIKANYWEKLEVCVSCELFTPVGVYALSMPAGYLPLADADLNACMRLLDASGLAVSNAILYEKTMELSKTDGLTGLKNHNEFKSAVRAEVLRAKRYQRRFAIFMSDVDNFKHYNDTNGHPQGDALLKKMAELIKDNFKDTDIVARYGGEEFAVLLLEPGSRDQAVVVAERLRGMIDWCQFPKQETQPGGNVTVSIGVSCYPEDGNTAEDIIKSADDALYRAKREGKNRVVAASPGVTRE